MNELMDNAQAFGGSDILRSLAFGLALYCFVKLMAGRRRVMTRAGDRLKNFYYAMICTAFTFGVGAVEGWLRDRGDNYTLYLILLVLMFMSTALNTGSPLEYLKEHQGFDRGLKSGLGENDPDGTR